METKSENISSFVEKDVEMENKEDEKAMNEKKPIREKKEKRRRNDMKKNNVGSGFRIANLDVDESKVGTAPEETWSVNECFPLRWFFCWFNPILIRGLFTSPDMQDLPHVLRHARCEYVEKKFDYIWPKLAGKPMRFLLAINYCFGVEFWIAGIIQLCATCSQVFLPKIMEKFLKLLYLPNENEAYVKAMMERVNFLRKVLPRSHEIYPPDTSEFTRQNNWEIWIYLALLGLVYFVYTWGMNYSMHVSTRVGMKVRSVLVSKVYQKSLRLSSRARGKYENGIIMNHVTMDATKIERIHMMMHYGWTSWIMLIGSIYFLSDLIDWGALTGTCTNFLVIPVVIVIMCMFLAIRVALVKTIDKRVNKTNEVLQSIRIIKFFAWEHSFIKKVGNLRFREITLTRILFIMFSILIAVLISLTSIVCLVAFLTYYFTHGYLDAISIFTSLTYFNMMRMPLAVAPMIIIMVLEMMISMGRIGDLLEADELEEVSESKDDKYPIMIQGGLFRWEVKKKTATDGKTINEKKMKRAMMLKAIKDNFCSCCNQSAIDEEDNYELPPVIPGAPLIPPKLTMKQKIGFMIAAIRMKLKKKKITKKDLEMKENKGKKILKKDGGGNNNREEKKKKINKILNYGFLEDINLKIKKGALTVVVGRVGSGKSSLLYAMLGEMKKVEGVIETCGKFTFTTQLSWIQNCSLYNNVLFGEEENKEKWEEIVDCCCLQQDLDELKGGKSIEIGEKGINLSGGQKYRVQLARACYVPSDIVLLDDPLAAVDAHVGKRIFHKCIVGYLKNRTRVLVTHQLNYLEHADWIVLMDEGRILEQGTYDQLMKNEDSEVFKLYSEYEEKEKKEEKVSALIAPLLDTQQTTESESTKILEKKKKLIKKKKDSENIIDLESEISNNNIREETIVLGLPTKKEKTFSSSSTSSVDEEIEEGGEDGDDKEIGGEEEEEDDDDDEIEIIDLTKLKGRELEDYYIKNAKKEAKKNCKKRQEIRKKKLEESNEKKRKKKLEKESKSKSKSNQTKKKKKSKSLIIEDDDNKIIQSEEISRGMISPRVILTYIYSMGCCGIIPLICILSVYLWAQLVLSTTDWWLSQWSDGQFNEQFGNQKLVHFYISKIPTSGFDPSKMFSADVDFISYMDPDDYPVKHNTNSTYPFPIVNGKMNCSALGMGMVTVPTTYSCPSIVSWCGCFSVYIPVMWNRHFDNGTKISDGIKQTTSVYIYAALGIISLFNMFIRSAVFTNFACNAAQRLHNRALKRVLFAPQYFFDTTPIGRIITRFSHDITQVDGQLVNALSVALGMGFGTLGMFFMICYNTDGLGAAFVVPLFVFYFIFWFLYRKTNLELKRLESISKSPILSHISETLNGMPTIRAYKQKDRFINRLREMTDLNNRAYYLMMVAQRWLGLYLGCLGLCFIFCVCIVLIIVYYYWDSFSLDIAYTSLALSYSITSTQMFFKVVEQICEAEVMFNSVERLDYYAKNIPIEIPYSAPKAIKNGKTFIEDGKIQFENYFMRYRPGLDLVLKNLSFQIGKYKRIGIVGRTGSGKSSLMIALWRIVESSKPTKLELESIYDKMNIDRSLIPKDEKNVKPGTIKIDGYDISELNLSQLRNSISIIPQDATLFSGTVKTNLDPFKNYSDLEIKDALESSYMLDKIMSLPGNLNAEVKQTGSNFSVGERQLLCLARALLRKSKIIVMDEATASVDISTDAKIQKTIRESFTQCTTLTIAHRLETIIDCDKILVMDDGYCREYDSAKNLLQNTDKYNIFRDLVHETGPTTESLLYDYAYGRKTLDILDKLIQGKDDTTTKKDPKSLDDTVFKKMLPKSVDDVSFNIDMDKKKE